MAVIWASSVVVLKGACGRVKLQTVVRHWGRAGFLRIGLRGVSQRGHCLAKKLVLLAT